MESHSGQIKAGSDCLNVGLLGLKHFKDKLNPRACNVLQVSLSSKDAMVMLGCNVVHYTELINIQA